MGVLNGNGSSNGTTSSSSNGHHTFTNGGASYSEKALLNNMEKGAAVAYGSASAVNHAEEEAEEQGLSERAVWAYSVGHVMNDATAACWFSYLLILLEKVRHLSSLSAGIVMFSGQAFDAAATPIVGLLSDHTPGVPAWGWSGRKVWYLLGTAVVFLCFLGVFATDPLGGQGQLPAAYRVAYFTACASMFNVGWAAVQVTHLAMIPELCSTDCERMRLVKLRYAFTILSNLSVFLLYLARGKGQHAGSRGGRFRVMAVVVLAVGSVCASWFLHSAKAPPSKQRGSRRRRKPRPRKLAAADGSTTPLTGAAASVNGSSSSNGSSKGQHQQQQAVVSSSTPRSGGHLRQRTKSVSFEWRDWFGVADFWLCAAVYMASRIVVNITQVYCQFFILDVLGLGDLELALVPLTIYLASLATTLAMDHVNAALGRKATLLAGSLVVLCASAGFYVLCPSTAYLLYPVCVVLGVGSTTVMVTSHSMANDLVDTHDGAAGGFLYGAFSLTDKLANGLLILAIQVLKEAACGSDDGAFPPPAQCSCLLRDVMSVLPALSAAVAVLAAHPVTSSSFGHVPPTPASPPTSRGGEDGQALGGVDIICTGEFRKLNLSGRYSSYVEPADQEVWSDWVI